MVPFLASLISLSAFFLLGFAGYFVLEKLKAPAPAILGPLLFLGAANILGLHLAMPAWLRPGLSIAMGIMLGLRFYVQTKGLVKIILLVSAWMAGLTMLATSVLVMLGLDRFTALFSATPGGLTELALVVISFGSDAFAVVLLQTTRMLMTLLVVPFIARFAGKRALSGGSAISPALNGSDRSGENSGKAMIESPGKLDWLAFAVLGLFSAWLFGLLHLPASNLLGPMIAVGIYIKLRCLKVKVNTNLQKFIQIGVGGLVGLSITRESVMNLPSYIMPILALNLIIIGGSLVLAFLLYKITSWNLSTCLIAVAPGGMSPMIMLSMEMGADSKVVVVFQVLRMILVLLFIPFIGKILL